MAALNRNELKADNTEIVDQGDRAYAQEAKYSVEEMEYIEAVEVYSVIDYRLDNDIPRVLELVVDCILMAVFPSPLCYKSPLVTEIERVRWHC